MMKPFRLFFGGSGLIGTFEVTSDIKYKLVIETVSQLRNRLLADPVLRQPIVHLFDMVYHDDSEFPDHLKNGTPLVDQIPNKLKIQQIRAQPPGDGDVVTFLTDAFPDLYLEPSSFREGNVLWRETASGRDAADKEEISINIQLVQLWLKTASSVTNISIPELSVLFIAVFLHELAHCALVWYGKGCCNSPKLGGIEEESGEYYEKTVFGGVSSCEAIKKTLEIIRVGFYKGPLFYPISENEAKELLKFDTSGSKPLPLLARFSLLPAPPVIQSNFRAKISLSRFKSTFTTHTEAPVLMKSPIYFYPTLKGDKKILPPKGSQS